ncbi:hypothetical protein CBF23_012425 [Marinomonas agarivorans]|nr:hypothetical protein CBF23_012425 [Marinomonas agarivorans]
MKQIDISSVKSLPLKLFLKMPCPKPDFLSTLPIPTVINLIKAIRQYQTIADLYLKPEHDINPYWVNEVIEQLKQKSGKLLLDEEGNR